MSESLVEQIAAAKEGRTTHEENVDLLIRLARVQGVKLVKKQFAARDAKIRNLLQKTGIAIRDLNTPRGIAEKFIREALALLDGQPEESTPTIKGFYGDPRDSA